MSEFKRNFSVISELISAIFIIASMIDANFIGHFDRISYRNLFLVNHRKI